jgi:hypothetical protein
MVQRGYVGDRTRVKSRIVEAATGSVVVATV